MENSRQETLVTMPLSDLVELVEKKASAETRYAAECSHSYQLEKRIESLEAKLKEARNGITL